MVVPVADSESDADFTEEDESEDDTFTVKNKKVVKQKTEKKAPPPVKDKKEKKPTKSSKAKSLGTFFPVLLVLLVWTNKENDINSPGSLSIHSVVFNTGSKDTKQKKQFL